MNIEAIISKNLSDLRKQKGLTQEELGNDLGYTFQAISHWETGKSLPSAPMIKTIVDYYSVPVQYLYEERDVVISKEEEAKLLRREKIQMIILAAILVFFLLGMSGMIIGKLRLNINGWTGFLWGPALRSL